MSAKTENFILKSIMSNHQIRLNNSLIEITERDLLSFGIKISNSYCPERVLFKVSMINKTFSLKTYKEFPLRLLLIENNVEREKINVKNTIEILKNISAVKIYFQGLSGNNDYLFIKSENENEASSCFESDKENQIFCNGNLTKYKENKNNFDNKLIKKENLSKPSSRNKENSSFIPNLSHIIVTNHHENSNLNSFKNKHLKRERQTTHRNDNGDIKEIGKRKAIIIEDEPEEEISKKVENTNNITPSMQEIDELFQKYANTSNFEVKNNENLRSQFSEFNSNSKRKRNHNINRIIIDKDNFTIDDTCEKENKTYIKELTDIQLHPQEIINFSGKNEEDLSNISNKRTGKRLKKANNILLNTPISQNCTICLEQIKNKTHLDTCKHEFCKDCIENWAKMTNVCPLCKVEFKKMIFYDNNKEMKKYVKRKKFEYEEEVESWLENCQESCMVCDNSNDEHLMLVCDRCSFYVCHTYCAGLDKIPEGEWICSNCSRENINNVPNNGLNNRKNRKDSLDDSSGNEASYNNENLEIRRRRRSRKTKNNDNINSLDDFIIDDTKEVIKIEDEEDEEFEECVIVEKSNIRTRLRSHNSKDKKNGVNRRLNSKKSNYRY